MCISCQRRKTVFCECWYALSYCIIFHGIVLHGIAWNCIVWHCTLLPPSSGILPKLDNWTFDDERNSVDDFLINLVYFCRRFLIESNFPFILLDTSSLLDFNEDASRESVASITAAASKSFSPVWISTAGLLPVHQDPASSSAVVKTIKLIKLFHKNPF